MSEAHGDPEGDVGEASTAGVRGAGEGCPDALFEDALVGAAQMDLTGRFVEVNERFCELTGYPREELLRMTATDLSPPEDRARDEAELRPFLERRVESFTTEKRYLRKDGRVLWVHVAAGYIRDARGAPCRTFGLVQDITRRKIAELERARAYAVLECGEPCYVLDAGFNFVFVNRGWERMTGMRREELLGQNMWELLPASADPRMKYWNEYHRVMRERVPSSFEEYYAPLDLWTDVRVFPTDDGGISAFFANANERKRVERVLEEQAEELREAQRVAHVGSWSFDIDHASGTVSEELIRMHGRTAADGLPDVLGNSWGGRPIFTLESHARLLEAIRGASEGRPYEIELEAASGGPHRFEIARGEPVFDANGHVVRVRGTAQDVTEARRVERAVRASEARLRIALESLPDMVFIFDSDLRLRYVNSAAELFPHEPAESLLGRTGFEVWPATHHRFEPGIRAARDTGRTQRFELAELAPGQPMALQVTCVPIQDPECCAVQEVMCIVHDFTPHRQAELRAREAAAQLREADHRKNEFIAVLSHELRNPLAPIRNGVFILEHADPASERARRAISMIDRQAQHMTRLIDDLLDVTRISRGKIHLQIAPVDLAELVRGAGEDQRDNFSNAGVELIVRAPNRPVVIQGDRTRLAQVIGNLLQNAVKFTPRNGHAWLELMEDAGDVCIQVRDDGAGMPPDMLERLFSPFVQADSTLDRSRGGLGLGLALVKGLVELHGGAVRADSLGPGRGSTFVVCIPRDARVVREGEAPAATDPNP